ncbi:MAG: hypothetical protein QOF69_2069 [Solirubrobacteraceae bacterium]|nr:hypothetical protein [Solirubrobacteraceae bacterium]
MRSASARFIATAALLATAVCALGAAPAPAAAALLPDLVADPPVGGNQPVVYSDAQGDRLLLRMDGFVHNRGPGPLDIRGSKPSGGVMTTVRQRVYDAPNSSGPFADMPHVPAPVLTYETNDDHMHWHLAHAMRYSLWSADRTVEVAPSQKVGFCLIDMDRVEAPPTDAPVYSEAAHHFCQEGRPSASSVYMGVSPGWRDIYSYVLAFQWVDISDVAPGRYWLRADADPDGVIAESDEVNSGAYDAEMSVVNGYLANPVQAGEVAALGTTITLSATRFDDVHLGSTGPLEFQIVTPPAGGTLDQPTGTWFSATQVRYTPKLGFSGADSFTVAARDASSPFPRNPRSAAVTLTVQSARVAPSGGALGVLGISGAPRSVYTSSQTQLHAVGPGVEQAVAWSVDGVQGGSASAGTISATGLYRAPAKPPPAGNVVVGARSATGATGQAPIRVVAAPDGRPAPTVKAPRVPRHGLSQVRVGFHDRSLVAVVSSAQTGRVRFTARSNGVRIGLCSMVVAKRGAATCMMRIPDTIAPLARICRVPQQLRRTVPGVIVTATLSRRGKVVATRRICVR